MIPYDPSSRQLIPPHPPPRFHLPHQVWSIPIVSKPTPGETTGSPRLDITESVRPGVVEEAQASSRCGPVGPVCAVLVSGSALGLCGGWKQNYQGSWGKA